jgi:transcriptional regulator with XRE-family HTH domain
MNLLSERLRWAIAEEEKRRGGKMIRPAELARAAKTSQTSVGFWLNDVNGIGAAKARLLADYLHVDALWLETGRGAPNATDSAPEPFTAPAGSMDPQAQTARELLLLMVHRTANEREREALDNLVDKFRRSIEARARDGDDAQLAG